MDKKNTDNFPVYESLSTRQKKRKFWDRRKKDNKKKDNLPMPEIQ